MRCFIALRPDDATRDRLDALARSWHQRFSRARRMRRANLHLTLAFIGDLEAGMADAVAARLMGQTWPELSWRIDRIGVFDKARVLWAGSDGDAGLDAIAARVRALLDDGRIAYDRKPFAPHVTLLRNVPRETAGTAETLADPILWLTAAPVLLQSRATADGVQYEPVAAPAA